MKTAEEMNRAYDKIIKCIDSSTKSNHCDVCMNMVNNFIRSYGIKWSQESNTLIKKVKEKNKSLSTYEY